jgi:hypothetical protein
MVELVARCPWFNMEFQPIAPMIEVDRHELQWLAE